MARALNRTMTPLGPESAIFLVGCLLQYGVVYGGVPALAAAGAEPMVAWMLLSIPCIFAPIIVLGLAVLRTEPRPYSWKERLRLQRPASRDWLWGGIGLIGLVLGSGLMFGIVTALGLDPNAPFSRGVQPLSGDRLWILGHSSPTTTAIYTHLTRKAEVQADDALAVLTAGMP